MPLMPFSSSLCKPDSFCCFKWHSEWHSEWHSDSWIGSELPKSRCWMVYNKWCTAKQLVIPSRPTLSHRGVPDECRPRRGFCRLHPSDAKTAAGQAVATCCNMLQLGRWTSHEDFRYFRLSIFMVYPNSWMMIQKPIEIWMIWGSHFFFRSLIWFVLHVCCVFELLAAAGMWLGQVYVLEPAGHVMTHQTWLELDPSNMDQNGRPRFTMIYWYTRRITTPSPKSWLDTGSHGVWGLDVWNPDWFPMGKPPASC